jgi:hypothetical protein
MGDLFSNTISYTMFLPRCYNATQVFVAVLRIGRSRRTRKPTNRNGDLSFAKRKGFGGIGVSPHHEMLITHLLLVLPSLCLTLSESKCKRSGHPLKAKGLDVISAYIILIYDGRALQNRTHSHPIRTQRLTASDTPLVGALE